MNNNNENALNALLGKGSQFEGKLMFEGTVRIDGVFKGEIVSKDKLIIGDGAEVEAEINAGTVEINGTIIGNIKATESIELRKHGELYGDIETTSLVVEKDTVFEGNCKMNKSGSKSKSVIPKKEHSETVSSTFSANKSPLS